nr:MAG TPA: hypothetical protein [Caudoviricetes sp.]
MSSHKETNTLIISIKQDDMMTKMEYGSVIELDESNQRYRRYKKDGYTEQLFIRGDLPVKKKEYKEDYEFYDQLLEKAALNPTAKDLKITFTNISNYRVIICANGNISYQNKACSIAPLPDYTLDTRPKDLLDQTINDQIIENWVK